MKQVLHHERRIAIRSLFLFWIGMFVLMSLADIVHLRAFAPIPRATQTIHLNTKNKRKFSSLVSNRLDSQASGPERGFFKDNQVSTSSAPSSHLPDEERQCSNLTLSTSMDNLKYTETWKTRLRRALPGKRVGRDNRLDRKVLGTAIPSVSYSSASENMMQIE